MDLVSRFSKLGTIGHGYGSEWHLLRYLGRHRQKLRDEILSKTGGDDIQWIDFHFSQKNEPLKHDIELKGVEFLEEFGIKQWESFWPQRGNAPNWDVVGKTVVNGNTEWLLVEAKSHEDELHPKNTGCDAKPPSLEKIKEAMKKTREALRVEGFQEETWLGPYYQFCNRLATLYFLNVECKPSISAHLVPIYFYGDKIKGEKCPQSCEEWEKNINNMYKKIGLTKESKLRRRIHNIYLSTNPNVI
jgi:hypothetical protein